MGYSRTVFLAIPFPNFDPVIIDFGQVGSFPIAIRWYGLLWLIGSLLAWFHVVSRFKDKSLGIEKKQIDDFLFWAVLSSVLGGRIGYAIFYAPENFSFFKIWTGGLSFHGGFIGVVLAIIFYSRIQKIPIWTLGDAIACAAPLGLFCVRIANFINGELYGRVTNLPWGVVFPNSGGVPRHPSQLYEAMFEGLILFLILHVLSKNPNFQNKGGFLTGVFISGYAIFRVGAEFFREPDAHLGFIIPGVTMGQILSLPLLLVGIYLIFRPKRAV